MANIKILVDSTCDLSKDILKENDIHTIPLTVHFGDEEYKDGIDLTPVEFYKMLQSNPHHPKTSQPTPEDFKMKYNELLADGSEIISIHLSSKMSGTIQSANMAKKELQSDRIHIIDSEFVSAIFGMIAIECAKAVKQGKSVTEIIQLINTLKSSMNIYFIVDTLEYLQKGGRIGKASAIIGGLLNIKPILTIKEGQVCPFEKIRGTKKVFERLTSLVEDFKNKNESTGIELAFAHASDEALLQKLVDSVNNVYNCSDLLITEIGPVVGTHVGPGTLAVCFYTKIGI